MRKAMSNYIITRVTLTILTNLNYCLSRYSCQVLFKKIQIGNKHVLNIKTVTA